MMGRLEELRAEYAKRLDALDPPGDQKGSDWAWLWFCRERYALDGFPFIFELCQKDPKDHGLANIWQVSKELITDRELFDRLRSETADLYVENLRRAGVLSVDIRERPDYLALTRELALEGVKACRPLRGLPQVNLDGRPPAATCAAVATAAATIWLRFVDEIHRIEKRPRVRELTDVMSVLSTQEREIRESDDFTAYALTDRERAALERDLGLNGIL